LAAPGSICVSGTVRDHIGDRLPYAFEDMGEQSVKNIARPVRAYALRPEGIAGVPTASGSSTTSRSPPFVAPRLSIVVLPFTNLSDDREQQYFADGITEDLTTDLSRLENMFVISRNTAFTYRNKPVDTRQIGRKLGVRYVLEGSVRRSGNQVRVNVQLIDAATDANLWAERFDRDTGDLFALQYYASDSSSKEEDTKQKIENLVSAMMRSVTNKGIAVYFHSGKDSDVHGKLARRFGNHMWDAPDRIAAAAKAMDKEVVTLPLESKLYFPMLDGSSYERLKHVDNYRHLPKGSKEIRWLKLLSFALHGDLVSLAGKRKLADCID
jgi:TolB-like protein